MKLFLILQLACVSGSFVSMEETVRGFPAKWTELEAAPSNSKLELTFAIRQQGLAELKDTLRRVSDPSSPDYGQHLSLEEVQKLTAPAPENLEKVLNFIRSHGAEPRLATPGGDFVTASVTVEVAERMLRAKYMKLGHTLSGHEVLRTPSGYSLPTDVADAVDFVAPTVHIPDVKHRPVAVGGNLGNSSAGLFNTPKNLRTLYSVGSAEGKATGNKQAVTAFLEQKYSGLSLRTFWTMFCSGITCGKGEPKLIGDATTGIPGTESMLDIETVTGVAGNVESEFWGFSGRSDDNPANEPFVKWLVQMSNTADQDIPKIFSTSYGEDESSWSKPAAERLNVEFQKAGTRGISLLFASGDEGANCKGSRLTPEGPGSSPYVTAVGGTTGTRTWPQPGGEAAAGLSSGGFSDYWPMPDYQQNAVAAYLKQSGLPDKKFGYNASGRAYPDISAQATNFFVVAVVPEPGVAGTSCASPTAAGLFALLNDVRLQEGKSTLGFLNPLIYGHPEVFNDITEGSSGGSCEGGDGWPAKTGWDAVTGVGTPNYEKLATLVSGLPAGRVIRDMAIVV